jgi:hypothetical protein
VSWVSSSSWCWFNSFIFFLATQVESIYFLGNLYALSAFYVIWWCRTRRLVETLMNIVMNFNYLHFHILNFCLLKVSIVIIPLILHFIII